MAKFPTRKAPVEVEDTVVSTARSVLSEVQFYSELGQLERVTAWYCAAADNFYRGSGRPAPSFARRSNSSRCQV